MNTLKEPSEQIVEYLRSWNAGSSMFKAIYDGDPDVIPSSNLPAICVVQLGDVSDPNAATGVEYLGSDIEIRVVFNKKDDWSVNSPTDDLTDKKIRRIVEERGIDRRYTSQSLKGALRAMRFKSDDGCRIRKEMRFELGSAARSNKDEDIITREGVLTITVDYMVIE